MLYHMRDKERKRFETQGLKTACGYLMLRPLRQKLWMDKLSIPKKPKVWLSSAQFSIELVDRRGTPGHETSKPLFCEALEIQLDALLLPPCARNENLQNTKRDRGLGLEEG